MNVSYNGQMCDACPDIGTYPNGNSSGNAIQPPDLPINKPKQLLKYLLEFV